jgi:lysyl-tRNA synthetase class 2
MDDTKSLIEQRRAKLKALEAKNIFPFKNKFTPAIGCGEARAKFEKGELAEHAKVSIAGRITAHREMGKSMFIDIARPERAHPDLRAEKCARRRASHIFTHLDLGDFIGVDRHAFHDQDKRAERQNRIFVDPFQSPAPAAREMARPRRHRDPLPPALSRPDRRIPEVKDVFLKRSEIVREIRNFLHARGYVEVETPMMQAIPGGAAAQPFKTHHNALGCDFYLRIALELYLKRLLVGGVDKVFEIGRNFRNEGLSRKHNPEFTMLEAYEAFGDYDHDGTRAGHDLKHVAQKVLGTLVIEHNQDAAVRAAIEHAIHDDLDGVSTALTGTLLKVAERRHRQPVRQGNGQCACRADVACWNKSAKPPAASSPKRASAPCSWSSARWACIKIQISGGNNLPIEDGSSPPPSRFDAVVRTLERLSTPKTID